MIYSSAAERQVDDLRRHYHRLERPEASENLAAALLKAESQIDSNPAAGLPAPRPYPELARPGRAWIKAGCYWITYSLTQPAVILGVFYETADIPRRL